MMKSLRDEICLWQMKSKPSLDEIKSTHPPSRRISSNACGISSQIRFIPPEKVDLVEKDSRLYPILSLFLVRETGLEPVHRRYTPLKRARLPIPPLPQRLFYYTRLIRVCQGLFLLFLN